MSLGRSQRRIEGGCLWHWGWGELAVCGRSQRRIEGIRAAGGVASLGVGERRSQRRIEGEKSPFNKASLNSLSEDLKGELKANASYPVSTSSQSSLEDLKGELKVPGWIGLVEPNTTRVRRSQRRIEGSPPSASSATLGAREDLKGELKDISVRLVYLDG